MLQAVRSMRAGDRRGERRWLCIIWWWMESRRIPFPDLAAAWEALKAGQRPALAPRGTAFRSRAGQLEAEARKSSREAESPVGRRCSAAPMRRRPQERSIRTRNSRERPTFEPGPANGADPCSAGAGGGCVYGRVNDVPLTAFTLAVADWRQRHNRGYGSAVLLDLEGHGRERDHAGD